MYKKTHIVNNKMANTINVDTFPRALKSVSALLGYGAVQMLRVSMFSARPLLTEWLYAMESGTEGPASLHIIYLSCHLKFKQNDRVKQKSQHHYCSSKYYR